MHSLSLRPGPAGEDGFSTATGRWSCSMTISMPCLGGEGTGAAAGRGGVEAAVGGLFEAVDPGVVAAGESVGEGFFEADLLFAGAGF